MIRIWLFWSLLSGEKKSGKPNINQSGTDPKHSSVLPSVRIAPLQTKGRVLQNSDPIFSFCVMGFGSLSFKSSLRKLVIIKLRLVILILMVMENYQSFGCRMQQVSFWNTILFSSLSF
jgi:hypothetical protein